MAENVIEITNVTKRFGSAEDIEVLCDTVHEMDLGVITRVK